MIDTLHTVTCRWVPGTLDRVRVRFQHHEVILELRHVARHFGREALDSLYLTGRYTVREGPRPCAATTALFRK